MAVSATVLEWGGDEDTAIAALLHDAVEDQGGLKTANAIRQRYGDRVIDIVLACTDTVVADADGKEPWEDRKRRHIAKLGYATVEVAQVTAADKLHNLSSLIRDVRREGQSTLERLARPDRMIWYFQAIADVLRPYETVAPVAEVRESTVVLAGLLAARWPS